MVLQHRLRYHAKSSTTTSWYSIERKVMNRPTIRCSRPRKLSSEWSATLRTRLATIFTFSTRPSTSTTSSPMSYGSRSRRRTSSLHARRSTRTVSASRQQMAGERWIRGRRPLCKQWRSPHIHPYRVRRAVCRSSTSARRSCGWVRLKPTSPQTCPSPRESA